MKGIEIDLAEKYKNVMVTRVNDKMVDVKLYKDELCSINQHVNVLFANNKLFYTGDMGTFVFGQTITNIFKFFQGDWINPDYWKEKCEASSQPLEYITNETIIESTKKFICEALDIESYEELDEEKQEYIEMFERTDFRDEESRAYDEIFALLEYLSIEHDYEDVGWIVSDAKKFSHRYLYACEVIQWVSNNLENWENAL